MERKGEGANSGARVMNCRTWDAAGKGRSIGGRDTGYAGVALEISTPSALAPQCFAPTYHDPSWVESRVR